MTLVLPKINSVDEPNERNGHISVTYRGYLVVYGGHKISGNDGHTTDSTGDLSSLSDDKNIRFYKVDTSQWKKYETKGKQSSFL